MWIETIKDVAYLLIIKKINEMGLQGGALMQRINDELYRFPENE